jgi:hypothetical protein
MRIAGGIARRRFISRTARAAAIIACVALALAPVAGARNPGFVHVSGGRLIGVGGKTLRLIGVDRSGTEYACTGPVSGGGLGYAIFQGPTDDRSIKALLSWDINAVALPLNEACWLGGYGGLDPQFSGPNYRSAIVRYVQRLASFGIYAVVRLAGAAPGDRPFGSIPNASSFEIPMADADHSIAFWSSVAATFSNSKRVLFQPFDEPHDISWSCLLHGCTANDAPDGTARYGTYQTAGDQAMVDAIRRAGARQPILISGPNYAADLSGWQQYMPFDPRHQLAADISSFDYGDFVLSHMAQLRNFARIHPVIVGGFGDTNCTSNYSQRLMLFMDSIHQSYLAWTWDTVQDYGGCSNALLDDSSPSINGQPAGYYSARPSGFGAGIKRHYLQLNAHQRFG